MKKILHRADTRGKAEHGWLHSRHTFSFADYYDPDRMRFGKLRVINDDVVEPGAGFATHPHDNMEIVSIPLAGALRHRDSMGHSHVIRKGEVQIMSAGTGLTHSEYNDSDRDSVNFLQIWVLPKDRGIAPRYGQMDFEPAARRNRFQVVVSPRMPREGNWINQDAYFSLADITAGEQIHYDLNQTGNGVYLFVVDGDVQVAGETLGRRDGVGLSGTATVTLRATSNTELLAIEIPMA
jgi:redox-sensitive bicupin YhaK (pirin superfamily)